MQGMVGSVAKCISAVHKCNALNDFASKIIGKWTK